MQKISPKSFVSIIPMKNLKGVIGVYAGIFDEKEDFGSDDFVFILTSPFPHSLHLLTPNLKATITKPTLQHSQNGIGTSPSGGQLLPDYE